MLYNLPVRGGRLVVHSTTHADIRGLDLAAGQYQENMTRQNSTIVPLVSSGSRLVDHSTTKLETEVQIHPQLGAKRSRACI